MASKKQVKSKPKWPRAPYITLNALCREVSEFYEDEDPQHVLKPAVLVSYLGDRWYAAVHTYPNGLDSRELVAACIRNSMQEAINNLAVSWRKQRDKIQCTAEVSGSGCLCDECLWAGIAEDYTWGD